MLDALARQLYTEKVNKGSIPNDLYKKTADDLLKALDEGLGGKSFDITDGRNTLKAYLQQNIAAFSAAKSLTQMNHMRSLMADAKDFTDFRNKCFDAGYQFNVNWLRTEYDTFTASAQMAQQWDQYRANGVEVFEFTTVGDDRVRPAHAALDGLTIRYDSPAIKRLWPPLDWACRCFMVPGIAERAMNDAQAGKVINDNTPNKLFHHHPGIDKAVVNNNHPYFKEAATHVGGKEKLKELDAQKNYGLPSVKKMYNQNKFPARVEMASETEYRDWWKDQVKAKGTDDFVLKDKTGLNILFDSVQTPGNNKSSFSYFKDHILQKSNEQRWSYAANLTDIITNADEIWSGRKNGRIVRYYLKYFDQSPMVVVAADSANTIIAQTMYELTAARVEELRRGELIDIKR